MITTNAASPSMAPYIAHLRQQAKSKANPGAEAAFRAEHEEYKSSYYAGQTSKFLPMPVGIQPMGAGADSHYMSGFSFFLAIERARFEDRDNMVLGQGITRLTSNVMQNGFIQDTLTQDDGVNEDLKGGWKEYANDKKQCDYECEKTFDKIAELAFRTNVVDGDIFNKILGSGQLETLEAHHCRSPWSSFRGRSKGDFSGIVHGVEIKNGARDAFHFTAQQVNPWVSSQYKTSRFPTYNEAGVRQVLQVYNPKRFSQRRGVTALAPIVFPTKYHDDLQFAALVNAKRQSMYAIIRELDLAAEDTGGGRGEPGSRTTQALADGSTQTNYGGTPGNTIRGIPGETIKMSAPNVPGQSHFEHADMLLMILAINLGLPLMVFLLDASKGNFSNYRGVMEQARQGFRILQRDLIDQLHTPVYHHYVRRRIATDHALRAYFNRTKNDIFAHSFTPEGWKYIQPATDAIADDTRLTRNLTSFRRRSREQGLDWPDLSTEITEDRALLIEKAIKQAHRLNDLSEAKAMKVEVNWREIAYGQPQGGMSLSMSGQIPEASANQPSANEKDQEV